jgi:hypothetical protein
MFTLSRKLSFTVFCLALALTSGVCFGVSDCVYSGVSFSDGAVSCQSGHQFRCSDGDWQALDLACSTPPPTPTVINPADCNCSEEEMSACDQLSKACCVSLELGKCTKRCCDIQ